MREKGPLLLAAGLSAVAFAAAFAAVRSQQRQAQKGWDPVRVLCAAQDLPEGSELSAEAVAVRELPSRFVSDSFIRVDASGPAHEVVGQRLLIPVKAGDPLLLAGIAGQRESQFASRINNRARAFSIDVQERQAVGHWVQPADHVDVLCTFKSNQGDPQTSTVLQNVSVLATGARDAGQRVEGDGERRYQTVTLLVLPEEAELLALAQEMGALSLSLRNPEDTEVREHPEPVGGQRILANDHPAEQQSRRPRGAQILRGPHGGR